MGFLRINRFGEIRTTKTSKKQCKVEGHERYRYQVSLICCDTNLDRDGFVIDHIQLADAVQRVFARRIGSCEDLILWCQRQVERVAKLHKIQVVDMYIRLQPVLDGQPEDYAYMEYSSSGKFV
jgi:hypothetical protein